MSLNTRRTGNAEYGRFVKTLICGEPGSGKTLISSTFPNPYFASAEGGLMSVAALHLPYLELTSSEELFELRSYLELPPDARDAMIGTKVETIVIDTVDEVQGMLIRERLTEKHQDKLTLQDFGWLSEQMQTIIRTFRNLHMHVVFTCHIKETRDDELGRIVYKPGMQGQIADKMAGFVDLSLLLTSHLQTEVVGKEARPIVKRQLQTFPDVQHPWVKDRSGKLPPEFPVNFKDDFARMNDLIFKDVDLGESIEIKSTAVDVPKPAAVPAAKPEQVDVPADGYKCEECGTVFPDSDQAELSKIRMRKTLCSDCYKSAKTTTRSKT